MHSLLGVLAATVDMEEGVRATAAHTEEAVGKAVAAQSLRGARVAVVGAGHR